MHLYSRRQCISNKRTIFSVRMMATLVAKKVFVVKSCRSHINQHLMTKAHFHSRNIQKETGIDFSGRQNKTGGKESEK